MDTTPLPSQDDDLSDNGLLNTYVVRITSYDKFTFDELYNFILQEPLIYRFVIGRETVPQEHFHLVLTTDISVETQDVKDIIRAFIVPLWQSNGKLPRGFGNKQYNLQLSEYQDKAISYAVKLAEYRYDGWSDEYIAQRKAESFEKKKPSNFKTEYVSLSKEFQESDMDIREFMIKYIALKAKYAQQVNTIHAYNYALSNLFLREPEQIEEHVENYLYKL